MGRKNKEPEIRQPSASQQRTYQSLRDNDATLVRIRKKKYKIRWLKAGQMAKLGRLLMCKKRFDVPTAGDVEGTEEVKAGDILGKFLFDQKLACKAAAIFILDGFWKLKLRYWFLWRWFYYIRQYDCQDLEQLIAEGKKKVPVEQFLSVTMYLIGAKDTLMMMRTEEAERILRELTSGASTASPKASEASATPDTSSSGS